MDAPQRSPFGGPLLASARSRLTVAGAAVLCLWILVLWASLSEPARKVAAPSASPVVDTLRLVVASGQAAPGGGSFNRFDVNSQPIVAPVNSRGQVAFDASVARAKANEGIFLRDRLADYESGSGWRRRARRWRPVRICAASASGAERRGQDRIWRDRCRSARYRGNFSRSRRSPQSYCIDRDGRARCTKWHLCRIRCAGAQQSR